ARMLEDFRVLNSQSQMKNDRPLPEIVNDEAVVKRLAERDFVALHYYGFLRREPDEVGLVSWTDMFKRRGDPEIVTNGFITSAEYRQRLELNKLRHVSFNRRYERFSDPVDLVSRKHVFSSQLAHAHAHVFIG